MGFWAQRVFPLTYDPLLWWGERSCMRALRAEAVGQARGRVLEIGAGTGLNVRHYPSGVDELVLSEPDEAMARRLENRLAHSGTQARVVRAATEELPFADESFDSVVGTLVLCTVRDLERSLAEIRRTLAPGGQLLFVEHVCAQAGTRLKGWQDRLHDPWWRFAAGCHCNRQTLPAIQRAGFAVQSVRDERWRGVPPILRPLIIGRATV